ncbi:MAG: putative transcriptional regulator [Thermoleophilaceae bacterium]|jgi:putative transcriptional regulator|nr:putative transcriptional regulator [Thermoleophilaceae bacterium]
MESLRGKLLVASPSLLDPNFRRTVVLIAEHSEDGALGVILNRESELEVEEAAPTLASLVEPGAHVHAGGPVQPTAVVIMAEFEDSGAAATMVVGDVGFVAADAEFDSLDTAVGRTRIFAGLAGWAPGQLEAEIERDDWILEPALPDDVFHDDADGLWGAVLERKGGEFALVARMPDDPSMN